MSLGEHFVMGRYRLADGEKWWCAKHIESGLVVLKEKTKWLLQKRLQERENFRNYMSNLRGEENGQ